MSIHHRPHVCPMLIVGIAIILDAVFIIQLRATGDLLSTVARGLSFKGTPRGCLLTRSCLSLRHRQEHGSGLEPRKVGLVRTTMYGIPSIRPLDFHRANLACRISWVRLLSWSQPITHSMPETKEASPILFPESTLASKIQSVVTSSAREIYILTNDSLMTLVNGSLRRLSTPAPPMSSGRNLWKTSSGFLWLNTRRGLYRGNGKVMDPGASRAADGVYHHRCQWKTQAGNGFALSISQVK